MSVLVNSNIDSIAGLTHIFHITNGTLQKINTVVDFVTRNQSIIIANLINIKFRVSKTSPIRTFFEKNLYVLVPRRRSVASDDQDVILITETWLCDDIDSLELFDDRYLVFRRDRGSSSDSCRRGEGVLIAVKKCFNPCILDLPGSDLEAVWLSIKLNHKQKMLVCVVYFPPSSRADTHISVWHSDKPLVPEDKHHPSLSISICFVADHPNRKNVNISRYDFRRADFLAMWCFFREIDWSFLLNFNDIDKAVFSFYNCLNDVFSRTVPLRQTVTRRFPFWYTTETRRLLKRKARVRRLALKCVNPDSVDEFRALRSAVKYSIQKDYNTYLRLTEKNLISNPRKFWSYFNNTKHNSPNSLYYNNVCYGNDGDIANAFADYFKSVFKLGYKE
ncbi:hypothetical protein AVEN_225922-1 [Araneus ventricosus]|uniref:Uncharacterized protein n=1 Tax=Araneus ventricosus TaxID=182803 RepID=A0A4Y2BBK3_ARAVE|nr:hypothetical protein AVEN_225922-1 [Araneus ventricosus]